MEIRPVQPAVPCAPIHTTKLTAAFRDVRTRLNKVQVLLPLPQAQFVNFPFWGERCSERNPKHMFLISPFFPEVFFQIILRCVCICQQPKVICEHT